MKEKYFENEYVEFWIENGILIEKFKSNLVKINIHIARDLSSERIRISDGKAYPMLVYTHNLIYMDKQTREFFAAPPSIEYLLGVAVIIYNPIALMGAKLFAAINKPSFPMAFFTNEHKALEWLEQFRRR